MSIAGITNNEAPQFKMQKANCKRQNEVFCILRFAFFDLQFALAYRLSAKRAKFSKRRSPIFWLFSGWNWQAKRWSVAMLDANEPEYGVVVATKEMSSGTT